MFCKILISTFMITLVQAQLNGEFWWLNSKLNSIKTINPSPPKIDISDFQDDESSKIIFRDDDFFTNKLKPIKDRTSTILPNKNLNDKRIVWPTEEHMKNHDVQVDVFTTVKVKEEENVKPIKIQSKQEDWLVFSYPKAEKLITIEKSNVSTELPAITFPNNLKPSESSGVINTYTSKLQTLPTTTKETESQNICTYTTKKKCYEFDGVIYDYARKIPITSGNEQLICCILPIQPILNENKLSHTVHFPKTSNLNRYKRSDTETNISSQQQRNFLLKHRFTPPRSTKPASIPLTKIVTSTEVDYADPYWNIKNTKFQTTVKSQNTKYSDYSDDSLEYADEVPKPGLIGLYFDHSPSTSNWPFQKGNKKFGYGVSYDDNYEDENDEGEDDEEENTFGYSTIDPRQGLNKQTHKVKPHKVATSDQLSYDAEKHTINFQSDPDFHVFQGFKLLNLFRNTSRVKTKKTSNQDTDVLVSAPDDSEQDDEFFDEQQLFVGCGKAIKKINEKGKQNGEAPKGTQPWLALVVLTKSHHNILCYATLLHTRAAITVADCVQGTGSGDVTVIAGLWDFKDKSSVRNRVASVHVHPQHSPGEVENNLAILYWMRPLRLSANIQPVCLGQPQFGDECKLVGWGTLQQGIQHARPHWQRAAARACSNKRERSPIDPFCLSTSRETVTGIGGPLICEVARHSSIVGVVVSQNGGYILSPVRDWAKKMDFLVTGD